MERASLQFPLFREHCSIPPTVLGAKVGSFVRCDKKKTQQSDDFFLAVSCLFAGVGIFRARRPPQVLFVRFALATLALRLRCIGLLDARNGTHLLIFHH